MTEAPSPVPASAAFDRDTAVHSLSAGRFAAELRPSWSIGRGAHGGYVAAIVLRALAAEASGPHGGRPLSLVVHYTRPGTEGPAEVHARREHSGRSVVTVAGRLVQSGTTVATALATFASSRAGPEFCDRQMPVAPPPEACPVPGPSARLPIVERFDTLRAIGGAPRSGGAPALTGGWIRLREPRPVDALSAVALLDGWMPAVFVRSREAIGISTVMLCVHFRCALPVPGDASDYSLAVFRSEMAGDGFVDEDGELWSPGGLLLAQSRQVIMTFPPG